LTHELTTVPGPDRTIPEELIDIAVLAIRRGAQRVSLLHEGLGADFPAPIGWLVRMRMNDYPPHPAKKRSVHFDHQIGCELDTTAPGWLLDEPDQPVIDELVELFQIGARNHWQVSYIRDYLDHAVMQSLARERPEHPRLAQFGMRHRLEATAHNWGYDDAAAARGDQISTEASLSIRDGENPDVVAFSNDGGKHRQVTQERVTELLREFAPNAARVAYYAGDEGGWVL
jgi:hypothetical protein